jgi:integrase
MARQIHRLSARSAATLKAIGRHSDGNGLYLNISSNGGRRWVFLYRRDGKLKEKGLGGAGSVSLADARTKADVIRKQLQSGLDPIMEGRKSAGVMNFAECADAFIAANKTGWRSAKHLQQWENSIKRYADPVIGKIPVHEIDVGHVTKVVEPLWSLKTETASRVRGRIEAVLDWAAARGYRASENPARWRGHFDKLLPARRKVAKVMHHPALPYADVPIFMEDLRKQEGIRARALEFTILTAARTGETIGAKWTEIDLVNKTWFVPGNRMKAGAEHRVPLSARAIEILERLPRSSSNVFPSEKPGKLLSNVAMLDLLPRMKWLNLTTHGFRSTFRDWAAEMTEFPNELVEMALAHTIENQTQAAYRRGNMLERRRALMAAWDTYCAATVRDQPTMPVKEDAKAH